MRVCLYRLACDRAKRECGLVAAIYPCTFVYARMWFAPTECASNDTSRGRQPLLSWRYNIGLHRAFLWNYCVGNAMAHLAFSSIVVATVMERCEKEFQFFEPGRHLLLTWHDNTDLLRPSICLPMQGPLPNEID